MVGYTKWLGTPNGWAHQMVGYTKWLGTLTSKWSGPGDGLPQDDAEAVGVVGPAGWGVDVVPHLGRDVGHRALATRTFGRSLTLSNCSGHRLPLSQTKIGYLNKNIQKNIKKN